MGAIASAGSNRKAAIVAASSTECPTFSAPATIRSIPRMMRIAATAAERMLIPWLVRAAMRRASRSAKISQALPNLLENFPKNYQLSSRCDVIPSSRPSTRSARSGQARRRIEGWCERASIRRVPRLLGVKTSEWLSTLRRVRAAIIERDVANDEVSF